MTAADESVHDKDDLQRVFNAVYGDSLFLAGVLSYNLEYVASLTSGVSLSCLATARMYGELCHSVEPLLPGDARR